MCHDVHFTSERLKDEIARELAAESADEDREAATDEPSFLNEERDADVELLTDGGE